jgi:translation initiation factor IF-3
VDIITKDLRINDEIRAREVRLIDDEGNQFGILPIQEALKIASEKQLDLVEVAPTAKPPVCRLMDYGKFKYEQNKKNKEAKKKQRVIDVKEIRMTPSIDEHDFQVKVRSVQKFLADGDKVKVVIRFKGRQIVHANLAEKRMLELSDLVNEHGSIERKPLLEGKSLIMILTPKN